MGSAMSTELNQIDLRLLRIFDAMHANRHVTRAAEELGLSQPTISIGLGRLRQQWRSAIRPHQRGDAGDVTRRCLDRTDP